MRQNIIDLKEKQIDDVQLIFHQAAQAGVRASWGKEFAQYTNNNVLATQMLLELARGVKLERFIYASSSSVYGASGKLPMSESDRPQPVSPYGVTKLAAEHLCQLYQLNFGVPTVSLRYFTVYGPCQRPDMAFNRFIKAALKDEEVVIYGTGEQTRDFTYIEDIITANLLAATVDQTEGNVYNIGGGSQISILTVLKILEWLMEREIRIHHEPVQAGDPAHTYADTRKARDDLGFKPQYSIEEGLDTMVEWFYKLLI